MATTPKGIYYPNDYNEIADIPEDMKKMAESIDEVFEDTDSDLSDIKEEQTTQNNRLNSLEVDNTTNKSDILTNKQDINNIKTEQTTQNNRLNNLETDNTTNKSNISSNTQEINNIKQEQTTQNTNISTNATNIESLQEENDNLKKIVSQLPQVTGQGIEITLENTIEATFTKFEIEGNSEQETTEGYNLLNWNLPYSVSSAGNIILSNIPSLEVGEDYYFVGKCSDGTELNSSNCACVWHEGNTQLLNRNPKVTFTAIDISEATGFYIYVSNAIAGKTISEFMLIKGTYSSSNVPSYEPYTGRQASPNPNYEQPIKSAGDNENLLDLNDIITTDYITNNGDGSITLNGTGSSGVSFPLKEPFTLKANNTYILSLTNTDSNYSAGTLILRNGNTNIFFINYNVSSVSYTPSQDIVIDTLRIYGGGVTFNNFTFKAKLEKGNKATPYSPYGMGSITEKIGNRNFLSFTENTISYAGVTTNISETKMKFNGKMASVTNIFNTIREDKAIPAGTYKLSYKKLSGATSGSGDWAVYFSFFNASGTRIGNKNFASNESAITKELVLSENVAYYTYYAYCNSTSLTFNDLELGFMITKDTPTDYVPHEEQDYSIFVQQPMRSNKDKTIKDKFVVKSDNKKYERHYIGELVLNGSEEIDLYNDNGNRAVFYINVSDLYDYTNSAETPELLSNRFRPVSQTATWEPGGIACRIGGRAIFFIFETGTTVNDFKNWLSTHNVVVQYKLAEPLDLPCTEEQIQQLENLPSTYKDFTYVTSEDETEAYLEVSGIYDLNKLITRTEVLESEV